MTKRMVVSLDFLDIGVREHSSALKKKGIDPRGLLVHGFHHALSGDYPSLERMVSYEILSFNPGILEDTENFKHTVHLCIDFMQHATTLAVDSLTTCCGQFDHRMRFEGLIGQDAVVYIP